MAKVPTGNHIPQEPAQSKSLATLAVRPQKLAFLLPLDLDTAVIREVIEFNTSVWGGFYNLMVPYDASGTISPDYLRAMRDYDADRVILCTDGTSLPPKGYEIEHRPFNCIPFPWLAVGEQARTHQCGPIDTRKLFHKELTQNPDIKPSDLCMPLYSEANPFSLYAQSQLGIFPEEQSRFYSEHFEVREVELQEDTNLEDYLKRMDEALSCAYPTYLSRYHLSPRFSLRPPLGAVVVLGAPDCFVEAFCAMWNWRMDVGGMMMPKHNGIVFLPIDILASQGRQDLEALGQWCASTHEHGIITLVAPPKLEQRVLELRDRLLPIAGPSVKSIECHFKASRMVATLIVEHGDSVELNWLGDATRIGVPRPSFDLDWFDNYDTWIVECDLEDRAAGRQSYFPPASKNQKKLVYDTTRGSVQYANLKGVPWRPYRNRLSLQVSRGTTSADLVLPSPEAAIQRAFQDMGFLARQSDKCKYIMASSEMLKDPALNRLFTRPAFRRLFCKMAKSDKGLTIEQMREHAKFQESEREGSEELFSLLLRTSCFLRGNTCRCPQCGLASWFPIRQVEEVMSCPGCTVSFQLPLKTQYTYRLNSLLATSINQGSLPVHLTEYLLKSLCQKTFWSVPGMLLMKKGGEEQDIDIAAVCDGELVLVECKTLEDTSARSDFTEITEQIERDYELAKAAGASIFCVATLADELPKPLLSFVSKKNRTRKTPLTIVLDKADLEAGRLPLATVYQPENRNIQDTRVRIHDLISHGLKNGFTATSLLPGYGQPASSKELPERALLGERDGKDD